VRANTAERVKSWTLSLSPRPHPNHPPTHRALHKQLREKAKMNAPTSWMHKMSGRPSASTMLDTVAGALAAGSPATELVGPPPPPPPLTPAPPPPNTSDTVRLRPLCPMFHVMMTQGVPAGAVAIPWSASPQLHLCLCCRCCDLDLVPPPDLGGETQLRTDSL
jgi:hypothetical protein